jgi:hypothetical protein
VIGVEWRLAGGTTPSMSEAPANDILRRSSAEKRRAWVALAVVAAVGLAPLAASARGAEGSPFESGADAAAIGKLSEGATVKRSSEDKTLTANDRRRILALGLPHPHAAAVVLHKIQRTDGARQLARLELLSRSLDALAPSDACDQLVATGVSRGMCSGHVDGPFGKVAVRMPVSARLTRTADGVIHLVFTNPEPLEAKVPFGWSEVVAPNHLKLAYDLYPTDDGWLVHARVGVEMSAHESSAPTIAEALLRLESWLTRDLSRT